MNPKKSYQYAIFDVDGTLLDTSQGIISSVQHVLSTLGLPEPQDQNYSLFIGPPIQLSLAQVYQLDPDQAQSGAAIFREQYKCNDLLKASLYPGILELFDLLQLNKIKIAVATYKRIDYAVEILDHFKLAPYCSVIEGADFSGRLTKQDIINNCISKLSVNDLKNVVMIGDTHHDAIGAEQAGIDFIGVTYGFGFRSGNEVMKYHSVGVVENAYQLLSYFEA